MFSQKNIFFPVFIMVRGWKEISCSRNKKDYLIIENSNEFPHPMSQSFAYKHQMI